ncbi:DNA ligase 1-like isoform X1 [Cimex lectularius]|uniref:WH2 domain-containing protein n=2 Tax=Cimex lectularius TaxID=79782 RepID=A0A8I6R7F7_CIMLE|nr:DNA ligase 1-like isoform X1 [Cimex lectularius]XP_024086011.1 DNA ligase 1-like isoform X1 [Cimex lectularius]
MPIVRPNADTGEKRTTFRPPWVKDVPPSLPAPPPAWVGKQQEPVKSVIIPNRPKLPDVRNIKVSFDGESKEAQGPPPNKSMPNNFKPGPETLRGETGKSPNKEIKPQISTVPPKGPSKEVRISTELMSKQPSQDIAPKQDKNQEQARNREETQKKEPFGEVKLKKRIEEPRKEEPKPPPVMATPPSTAMMPPPPPPPCLPPAPPPPPPTAPPEFTKKPMTVEKAAKIEALKSRPRRRPDWTDMMKEVEAGIKLKKVKCNDRSAPVLPKAKAKGQFVYDSEKQNAHNQLLKEIQHGVHLKKVKTNDRSKPILQGLRKFRRQMTIEEQIQKSASVADVIAVASEPDELDDIDKVRDDLQSTKQMLALELRNKEALERENKRLMARLLNLEVELEKEKLARKIQAEGESTVPVRTSDDETLIAQLKQEAAESAKITKEMEEKYHKTAEELDYTRAKLESAWLRNTQLEMELKSKGSYNKPPLVKQPSSKKLAHSASTVKQDKFPQPNDESESEGSETETDGEYEDEEVIDTTNAAEKSALREQRELKLLVNKLKTFKEKRIAAIKEKKNLKNNLSKLQSILKEERKKYRLLQKEVDKMASLMKDVEDDEDKEEEEEDDDDDDEDEETETESESDEDDRTESEGDLPEDAAMEDKVANLNRRIKNHEMLLQRAKKGNYLLKANIDRRQDDLNRQKEMSLGLQEDLNAVLSELG